MANKGKRQHTYKKTVTKTETFAYDLPPVEERDWAKALIDCMHRLEERRLINLNIQEESLLSDAESEGRSNDIAILQQRGVEINL